MILSGYSRRNQSVADMKVMIDFGIKYLLPEQIFEI